MGKMFFVITNAYSKWFEVHVMPSPLADVTVEKIQMTFSTFGLPELLVSDNGPQFTGAVFDELCRKITSP